MKAYCMSFALALCLASSCRLVSTQNPQPEVAPVLRVSFTTPESSEGQNEARLADLEALLVGQPGLTGMTATRTWSRIMVTMRFADKVSLDSAVPPAAMAIQLFTAANPGVQHEEQYHPYDD